MEVVIVEDSDHTKASNYKSYFCNQWEVVDGIVKLWVAVYPTRTSPFQELDVTLKALGEKCIYKKPISDISLITTNDSYRGER
jgi:hypothetical protein